LNGGSRIAASTALPPDDANSPPWRSTSVPLAVPPERMLCEPPASSEVALARPATLSYFA
jgi:hypothetical protein